MSKDTGFILRSTLPNGPVFTIVQYDQETKMGKLIGSAGVEFKENLDKARLKQWGYRIEPKPTEVVHAVEPEVQT